MGICQSAVVVEASQKNGQIEKELRIAGEERSQEIKLLLLGTAECGKSTILKQMRILHSTGFSSEELAMLKSTIYFFIISSMLKILENLPNYNVGSTVKDFENSVNVLQKLNNGCDQKQFQEVKKLLQELWQDTSVQEVVKHGPEYHLSDSVPYFFENINRIGVEAYVPTEADVLRVRVKTTGVVEIILPMEQAPVKVVDVGGQRSERRKWIHCFDDVSAVFFIMALNEYDQFLEEDANTHRMSDSLRLFAYICNHDFFVKAGMILFMNKKDLFENKLKNVPLNHYFKAYTGPNSYEPAVQYIKEQFVSLNRVDAKSVYSHQTCATDTGQVKFVLDSCFDMIFRDTVESIGFS